MPAEVQKRASVLSVGCTSTQALATLVRARGGHVLGASCLPTQHCLVTGSATIPHGATSQLPTPSSLCCSVGWDSNCHWLCWQECEDLGLGFWRLSPLSFCPWWQVSQILQYLWAVSYLTSKGLWSSNNLFVQHGLGGSLQCYPSGWIWAFFPYSVMYLQFVVKSHLFFTAGKDGKIKQWDADKFEHIQTLEVGSFGKEGSWKKALFRHEQHFPQGLWAVLCSCPTSSVYHTGTSPGGMVFGTQSQWRLCGVRIPWQVPAPLGKDKGAACFGRGEGDGESCILPAKDNFQTCFLPGRQILPFFHCGGVWLHTWQTC